MRHSWCFRTARIKSLTPHARPRYNAVHTTSSHLSQSQLTTRAHTTSTSCSTTGTTSTAARSSATSEIQRSGHDFFAPQPKSNRGARAYYLHSIIHDYDDCHALKILQHLKDAMIPGYSKLLLHDVIIPPLRASRRDTSVDVHMMAKLGGRERTEDMLLGLVKGLGFQVRKIWRSDCSEKSILEAELPSQSRQGKYVA